jgi:hypothetical protein
MDIAGGDVSKHWRRRRERIRLLDEGNIDICNSFGKTSSASPSSRASSGVPKINLDTTERGGSLRVVCYTFLSRKALYRDTALTCSGQVVWEPTPLTQFNPFYPPHTRVFDVRLHTYHKPALMPSKHVECVRTSDTWSNAWLHDRDIPVRHGNHSLKRKLSQETEYSPLLA